MGYFFAAAIGYLLGSSNMAYYLAKLKKIDLRKRGSGNLGTSNAWTELGMVSSILVFLHDAGKAVLAVLLASWLFPDYAYSEYIAGVAAVLGHIFPFYLKFKGGKGHAAYVGMAFALNWWVALLATPFCVAAWFISDYMVGLVFSTILLFPSLLFIIGDWVPALITFIASAFVFYRHTENIKRIMNGTEAKFLSALLGKSKKSPALEETAVLETSDEQPETEEIVAEEVESETTETEEVVEIVAETISDEE